MTSAPLIHHVALLVADLDKAVARWSAATGYTFSEVARYRTDRYCDRRNPAPHHHDARISFSKEGPPYIELMEFHGSGTHGPDQGEGFHHLGFMDCPSPEDKMIELASLGIFDDGMALDDDDRILLWFTSKQDLNGMRLEFVSSDPQPIIRDDGSEPYRDVRGCPVLWPPEEQ
ncbi:VOC family protein [Streptomyces lavendulae]|uniref:VOC family protein n=1 Tax=Streptomyces lavendulae TaxID=1914 RepID=UPI0036BC1494